MTTSKAFTFHFRGGNPGGYVFELSSSCKDGVANDVILKRVNDDQKAEQITIGGSGGKTIEIKPVETNSPFLTSPICSGVFDSDYHGVALEVSDAPWISMRLRGFSKSNTHVRIDSTHWAIKSLTVRFSFDDPGSFGQSDIPFNIVQGRDWISDVTSNTDWADSLNDK